MLTAGRMGPMIAKVQDGKLVETKSALAQTVPNSLQLTGPDQVHTKARVKYPMVRKGYLANPSSPEGVRGKDEFVRVSWDEATSLSTNNTAAFAAHTAQNLFSPDLMAGVQVVCCIKRKPCCNAT